jgi:hypothetical protein
MIFSWLKGLRRHPKEISDPKRVVVIFDGDQSGPHVNRIAVTLPNVEYFWVQNSRATIPKRLKNLGVKIIRPSDLGKESVDTYIAMKTVQECMSSDPPAHVYIVSRDGDFIDVILNAAHMFTTIHFTLMIKRDSGSTRKHTKVNLPKNAKVLFFRDLEVV